jgi:hypothetical protein
LDNVQDALDRCIARDIFNLYKSLWERVLVGVLAEGEVVKEMLLGDASHAQHLPACDET